MVAAGMWAQCTTCRCWVGITLARGHLEQLVVASAAVGLLRGGGDPVVELQCVVRWLAVAVSGEQEQHQVLAGQAGLVRVVLDVLDGEVGAVSIALQQLRPAEERRP